MHRALTSCAFFLLTLSALPAMAQKKKRVRNTLTTVSVSTDRKPYANILISGFGSTPVRHFMENLSPLLTHYFDSLRIQTQYTFMGYRKELAERHLETALQKHQPDALLMFYETPDQLDTITVKYRRNSPFGPLTLLTTARPNEQYAPMGSVNMEKKLHIVLWEPATNKVVWRGLLQVAGYPGKDKFFIETCKLVTDEFLRHALVEGPVEQ